MSDFRVEDEIMGKAYDARLMKRLLEYALPYWKMLLLCVFLLLIVTGVDLARPYLIKIAIDEHINSLNQPLLAFSSNQLPEGITEEVSYQGLTLVRETDLPGAEAYPQRYQIIEKDGSFYLLHGVIGEKGFVILEGSQEASGGSQQISTLVPGGGRLIRIETGGSSHPAETLPAEIVSEFRENDIGSIARLGLLFLGLILTGFILNYLQVFFLNRASQQIIYNMRQEIFAHLQKMSLSYFDANPVGRLVTRVTNDTETLNDLYTNVIVYLFKDIFLILGIIVIMFQLNWRLALVSSAIMPLVFLAAFIFRRYVRDAYRLVRVKLARINAALSENISGMMIIQAFNQQQRKFREFVNINGEYYQAGMKRLRVFAVFRPSMDLFYSLALALIIWYGGGRVLTADLQFGVLYAFINYIQRFFRPINDLTEKYNIMQSAMASSERIFRILDTEEDIKNPPVPRKMPARVSGRVEFNRVWFAYQDEDWVLKDINFTINPGETIALVGATGAGKSSVIKLLSRLYDIQQGEILIDGIDIKKVAKDELRRHIGVVLQDVFLFSGDIESNIRLNCEEISGKAVREAARYVNAEKFIDKLSDGYQHQVKERGATLSTGQRQLLAFARALAFDPDILVLDEATASIDTETELLIQDALEKLTRDRTTIVIAHRLSTIQHADKIIVLHRGEIREMGSHQELLTRGGIYYDLYQLQYKDQSPEVQGGS